MFCLHTTVLFAQGARRMAHGRMDGLHGPLGRAAQKSQIRAAIVY
jgi:hypothetical protein